MGLHCTLFKTIKFKCMILPAKCQGSIKMFAAMLLVKLRVWKYQAVFEACFTFLIVFWEEKTVFGSGIVALQDFCYWSASPLIPLCLVLSIYGDESWRQEVEI